MNVRENGLRIIMMWYYILSVGGLILDIFTMVNGGESIIIIHVYRIIIFTNNSVSDITPFPPCERIGYI